MTLTIAKSATTIDLNNWMIASAFKCSRTESELFKALIVAVLSNLVEKPPFWKIILVSIIVAVLSNLVEEPPFWKKILASIWRVISFLLWVILILVVLSSIGRHLTFGETSASVATSKTNIGIESSKSLRQVQKNDIKAALDTALDTALVESRKTALRFASNELDTWIADLMKRVDDPGSDSDFLDWYFGYWTQGKFGLDGFKTWGIHIFNKNSPTAKERIQEMVLQELTNKVFRPEIAKLELKTISRDMAQVYTNELWNNLENVHIRYNIPTADWNSYLQGLTVSVADFDGRQVPLSLKAFAVGSIGGSVVLSSGSVVLSKGALLAIEKVTAKIGAKVVAQAAASISAKVGAFAGSEFLWPAALPVVTVAIAAWDAIDIHNTEIKTRRELRQNIEDYFKAMKRDILEDEENGIQKLISNIETSVRKSVANSRFRFRHF